MTKQDIEAVLDRVKTWPQHRQEDAALTLQGMEKLGTTPYLLSEEEERSLDEAEASGIATAAEVDAVLNRFR